MNAPALEIGDVQMSFAGADVTGPRAELISRRAFEILQEMVETDMKRVTRDYTIEHLVAPRVEVSFAQMSDETIAQATAQELFRALLNAI